MPSETTLSPKLEPSWLKVLEAEFHEPYMAELKQFLQEEMKQYRVYPPGKEMFNAFRFAPFEQVRVVLLGQDPYHGPGQAHGLCFSVRKGIQPPPSLVNIFRELSQDLGVPMPAHGCLEKWARQGVLLLNTVLSVRAHKPQSHKGRGWERFTDRVIRELNQKREKLAFLLWGRNAQAKESMIDPARHHLLKAAHPSPFSADRGFFGCRHFSKINRYLSEQGSDPIDWALDP